MMTTNELALPNRLPTSDMIYRASGKDVPALLRTIEAFLVPATTEETAQAVTVLLGHFKIPENLASEEIFVRGMIEELSVYPPDIFDVAIREARRTIKWLPAIAEMIEICDRLVKPRRAWLRHLLQQKKSIDEAERERREERDRQISYEQLFVEKFGSDILQPGDFEAAWREANDQSWENSPELGNWLRGISHGDPWARDVTLFMAIIGHGFTLLRDSLIDEKQMIALVCSSNHAAHKFIDDVRAGKIEKGAHYPDGETMKGGDPPEHLLAARINARLREICAPVAYSDDAQ